MLDLLLKTLWLLLPAYTPNNFAVLVGGGRPMDFGKSFFDGRRILGDGKTWNGFFGGFAGGIFTANIQYAIEKALGFEIYSLLPYADFFALTSLLAAGAMIGDLCGSFVKRRLGYERGERFLFVDQLAFLAVAILIASLYPAFWKIFTAEIIAIGFLVTPILHIGVNYLAYRLSLKEVPW